jgi:DNA-binding beta-propeller fold protein YncE
MPNKSTLRSKKSKLQTGNAKKRKIGKGMVVLSVVFGLALLAVLTYVGVDRLTQALTLSKIVQIYTDMEVDGSGPKSEKFKEAQVVAASPDGGFYVSDFSAHNIRKFDSNGQEEFAFGTQGKGDGQFVQPSGLIVDGQGNLLVCDTFNHRVQKFDGKGKFLSKFNHGFFGPRDLVEVGNRIFVCDTGNHKIQVFDLNGNFLMEWGGFGSANGQFQEPVGITADPGGFLYVADSDNRRIQKFDLNGRFLGSFKVLTWKGKNEEMPYLAFYQGNIYASNASRGAVLRFTTDGKLLAIYQRKDTMGETAGIAVDTAGRVLVVEKGINRVARFVPIMKPGK